MVRRVRRRSPSGQRRPLPDMALAAPRVTPGCRAGLKPRLLTFVDHPRVGSSPAWLSTGPAGPSLSGERRRDDPPSGAAPSPLGAGSRGRGVAGKDGAKAGPRFIGAVCPRGEVRADGSLAPRFEILGGFVIILRQGTERHFQIVLPTTKMVCSVARTRNVDHPCETGRSG